MGYGTIASSSRSVESAPDRRWRAPVEPVRAVSVWSGANEPWPENAEFPRVEGRPLLVLCAAQAVEREPARLGSVSKSGLYADESSVLGRCVAAR
jgi:hypothetical protein